MFPSRQRAHGWLVVPLLGAFCCCIVPLRGAALADSDKRAFNLAADTAERSLKVFSEQSGRGVIFVTDAVKGIRTNHVKGRFTPRQALDELLRGTGLVWSNDALTGAFAVRRQTLDGEKNATARRTTHERPERRGQGPRSGLLAP